MPDRRTPIVAELEQNLAEIMDLYRTFSAEELAVQVYTEGPGWTVKQVLAHFITIEESMHWLFRNILGGGQGSPGNFDIDRFNQTQPAKLDDQDLEALTAQFRSVRQETIAMVHAMTDGDLDRPGWHAFHGKGTLERFVVWAYEHTRLHIDDLRKTLTANKP